MSVENLWVVIPMFNEEKTIERVLDRLWLIKETRELSFTVVVVDNGSTDNSVNIVKQMYSIHGLPWVLIEEEVKGTGAAADTGFRYAISHGATHVARTDADCLPDFDWLDRMVEVFDEGFGMVAGRITARTDDTNISKWKAKFFDILVPVAASFGRVRPLNRGPQFKGPYVMTAGCNVGVAAWLYEKSGGFPRTKIEDTHEDRVLVNRVRTLTDKYGYFKNVHVKVSARRIASWGVVNTLKWYANHSYCPPVVDIR